jgi:phosphoribosyl-AMP cyclohydrolase / phosphoribosyl-ATP pyrophosphohydrolase
MNLKFQADGLIPVIVQEATTLHVLMHAYMNEEAYQQTLNEGVAVYYSRSRQQLWRKGDTSGHVQKVVDVFYDCDADALLLLVEQTGVACHTLHHSCFYQSLLQPPTAKAPVIDEVFARVKHRQTHPVESSYTQYLFSQGIDKILKKVGEENAEIIIAAKNKEAAPLYEEIADWVYHVSVLLAAMQLEWQGVYQVLKDRQEESV